MTRDRWWGVLFAAAFGGAGCMGAATENTGAAVGIEWDDPATGPTGRWQGQTEFESAGPWSRIWGPWLRSLGAEASPEAKDAARVIEESDIFKVAGDTLWVLNPYRGLVAIDIYNPDRPEIVGRAPIFGSPKDMYVRGDRAFVLMNDYYSWGQSSGQYRGSQVLVVDVQDATEPEIVGSFPVAGNVEDSRLVGDILYVVSASWAYTNNEYVDATHVLSVDVSNPSAIHEVDRESFDGTGGLIHVTEEYIFVAMYDWQSQGTKLRAVDISDPSGQMALGGEVTVEGYIRDRFMMSFAGDHLRVVSNDWQDGGHIFVDTFDATHALSHSGHLDLGGIGQLTAARFGDDVAYLVHQVRIDPLDVIDLSNPSSPIRLSSLEIPGWLEHVEIRGNRVLGIGFDQANTTVPARTCPGYTYEPLAQGRMLSAAIFDVTDPGASCEAARVRFGEGNWAWSNAFYDDKALRFLDSDGLLLVPFGAWMENDSVNAVQMIDVDLEAMSLAVRGRIDSLSTVDRSFVEAERLMAFGTRELVVANITDRSSPVITANLELTRNVAAFSPAGNMGQAVQLVGDWNEDAELRVVDVEEPDAEKSDVLGTVSVGAPIGEMYVSKNIVTVVSRRYTDQGSSVRIANFDVSDPWSPRARGALELPAGYGGGYGPFPYMRYSSVSDVVRVQSSTFVVSAPTEGGMRYSVVSTRDADNPRVVYEQNRPNDETVVYDLRVFWNALYVVAYTPVEVETPEIDGDFGVRTEMGENPEGSEALTSRIMPPWRPRRERVRYTVTRVTFSSNGTPTIGQAISVPGRLVDVSRSGKIWTLLDSRWTVPPEYAQCGGFANFQCADPATTECQDDPRDGCDPQNGGADCGGICVPTGTLPTFEAAQSKALFTVRVNLGQGTASLLDGIPVEEGVEDVKVRGNAAYYTMFDSWRGPIVPLNAAADGADSIIAPEPREPQLRLVILNFSDPSRIHEASSTAVESNGSGGNLLDVRNVTSTRYAFLGMGWGGFAVYDVTSMNAPELDQFVRSNAWYTSLVVSPQNRAAYVAGGYYGVQTIDLD
ncbi:MAG: beta-propeller domain-containing protein [Deltaproteobacteria bacterium]|nr:beta-propeller domain-containing protein [Deltaproteobacteria bacterium]